MPSEPPAFFRLRVNNDPSVPWIISVLPPAPEDKLLGFNSYPNDRKNSEISYANVTVSYFLDNSR
jgi:hypothetical protein